MDAFVTAARLALIVTATFLFTPGCDRDPPTPVTDEPPTVPADDLPSSVVPAGTRSASASSVPDMTSYEVAIAIAAANRKKAEVGCESLPAAKRESCLSGVAARSTPSRGSSGATGGWVRRS